MQLFIRLIDNKLIVLDVHPHQTIGDIKEAIYNAAPTCLFQTQVKAPLNLHAPHGTTICNNNDYSGSQYGVSNEQTLKMICERAREPSIPISE